MTFRSLSGSTTQPPLRRLVQNSIGRHRERAFQRGMLRKALLRQNRPTQERRPRPKNTGAKLTGRLRAGMGFEAGDPPQAGAPKKGDTEASAAPLCTAPPRAAGRLSPMGPVVPA